MRCDAEWEEEGRSVRDRFFTLSDAVVRVELQLIVKPKIE